MSIWVIGDIQGCNTAFSKLLDAINFNPKKDRLWLTGDLVNRGEDSLEVLRFVYKHKESIAITLGNHDIALIASYMKIKKPDATIEPILQAKDADKLIKWLQHQPLLHHDKSLNSVMVHAGIAPWWTLCMAKKYARRVEKQLQSSQADLWLKEIFETKADTQSKTLRGVALDNLILTVFTRMRFCYKEGCKLELKHKESPSKTLEKGGIIP